MTGFTITKWIDPKESDDGNWHHLAVIYDGFKVSVSFDGDMIK